MDAAEDPGDAQLCWPRTSGAQPWSDRHRSQKQSGTFDLFEDTAVGVKELEGTLPPTVQVHNIAADDDITAAAPPVITKLEQDDHSTLLPPAMIRTPWADVEDDDDTADVVDDDDPDLTGCRFPEELVDDATADADSRGLHDQSGPIAHGHMKVPSCTQQAPCTELRTQCGPSDQTSLVSGTSAGLVCQQHAGKLGEPHPEHHLSPVVEFVLGGGTINNAPVHGVGSDELCALGYSDTLGYDYSLGPQSATMQHVDFQTFARDVLPDVYPASGDESSIGDGAHTDADDADAEFTRSHADDSVGSLRTQFGPCPLTLAQYAPQVPALDVGLHADVLAPKMQTVRTQCGPLPQQHFQTPGTLAQHAPQEQEQSSLQTLQTQCGQLPQQHLLSPCAPGLSNASTHSSGAHAADDNLDARCPQTPQTQCGPLPLDVDFDFFPDGGSIFDSGRLEDYTSLGSSMSCGSTKDSISQALGIQCEALPLDVALAGMRDSLAQLIDTASDITASHEVRLAQLQQYADATAQFARWDYEQAQQAPLGLMPSATQPGPLELGPSPLQSLPSECGAGDGTHEAATTRLKDFNSKTLPTPRTQPGHLPQQQHPRGDDRLKAPKFKDLFGSAGTQCGPLPQAKCGPLPQQQPWKHIAQPACASLQFGPSPRQEAKARAQAKTKAKTKAKAKTRQ